jgi:DtxR family Mn-dependent transcriptional regulator
LPALGQAVEDYLKAIFKLQADGRPATTSGLADELGVSDASATSMSKKLASLGLVTHAPYHGVTLTDSGRRVALEIVRHHRLLELYLAEVLGYRWDEVHEEADRLEHFISEEFEERIDALLGRPTVDPHGDPIPTKDLQIAEQSLIPLSELAPGSTAVITRVSDREPAHLRALAALGLLPTVKVHVRELCEEGLLHVQIDAIEQVVDLFLAGEVFVTRYQDAG